MNSLLLAVLAVAALLFAGSANASCIPPQPPDALPDGATATYEAMADAHREVREFDNDVRQFAMCLALEIRILLEDPTIDEETKDALRLMLTARTDEVIDEAEFVVEKFNEELRAFRARGD